MSLNFVDGTNPDRVSVAVCFPSGEQVNSQFMLSVISMLVRNNIPLATVANSSSCRVAFNRNALVNTARQAFATHVLFMDADMVFPTDAFARLFSHDLDIVGATASKRNEENDAIGTTLDGSRLQVPSPPVKMKLLGPCFMLVKMKVFDTLPEPWFAEPPRFMMGEPDSTELMPEDEYFCQAAIKAGFDVHCDINLSMYVGHRGAKTFKIMQPTKE